MKKFILFCLTFLFVLPVKAELTHPIDLLNAMMEAHKNRNYEIHYILQHSDNIKSMKYHHALENNHEFAQLLSLDNAYETILLRNNAISYLGFNFTPFSLKGTKILDALPAVFHANFNELNHYDFVPLGKSRVADRIANVIKIVPSDSTRFSYTLWIDEQNYLLLKSELFDNQNTLLEQFRVIEQRVNDEFDNLIPQLKTMLLPPVNTQNSLVNTPLEWQVNWLPVGFKPISSYRQVIPVGQGQEEVESQLFSDGLSTFTVYLRSQGDEAFNNQFARQEKLILFTHILGNRELVVIGDIPMPVAEKVAQSVVLPQ
ncbi:MAG: MucB/RseB C-terminal domain-containing protein [Haemophilus paraphrohaemolyticus]|uniref:MucB/RseB C-terminal domain-containing protein n=1 Tax=Haemophilus paraphrohaemolyticus TaxID=736 RepID=UPI001EBFA370|nr:MucB/RseB C-terminal domain-containing protein [Haemophilus paraphrohaemolyticus]MBS6673322.1 MucB/RseB C-terminal domain-containing protein [Haemophilus paraphrohaemolyticus]